MERGALRVVSPCLTLLAALTSMVFADDTLHSAMQRGIADGVFSKDQVTRGRGQYLANCNLGCHGPGLTGSERVPALAGEGFVQRWQGRSVNELFQRIKLTMPQTAPRSLSDETYVDIAAFVLDSNGYPPGPQELRPDAQVLRNIIIVAPDNG